MHMNSHISAAALAAALLTTPQLGLAQGLDLGVNIGGDSGINVDAGVDLDNGLDIGADVGIGDSSNNVVDLDAGVGGDATDSDSSSSLVDVDLGLGGNTSSATTGPNGGALIDLNGNLLDADVTLLDRSSGGSTLVNGDIRLAALGQTARGDAILGLIEDPNLADIDLDTSIDDTRVAIVAAADLFDADTLADIELAVNAGGEGRTQLLEALSASVELSAILGSEGIDLSDVLAVQVAENGATEVFVLGGPVQVAALGADGNLADLTVAELAVLDIDLLSDDELAEIDLALLPEDARARAIVRLLEDRDPPQPGTLPDGDLVTIDLGALTDDAALAEVDAALTTGGDNLAELTADIALLERLDAVGIAPEAVAALRIGTDDDLLVFVEAGLDDTLTASIGVGGGTGTGDDGGLDDGAPGGDPGTDPDLGDDDGIGTDPGNTAGSGSDGSSSGAIVGTLPATSVGAGFAIAALTCETGILALANGTNASPPTIAAADRLELVRIEGCERSLVDADIAAIHGAIDANPAISSALDGAGIPLDQVIGATVQGDVLTLFLDRTVS
jgi:hypothetical protein